MNDQTKRPIDRRRNAAVSMSIGSTDGDGEIVEMISIDSRLHTIMENAVYAIQLADDVDPARTNEAIQNNQQRVLVIGVGRKNSIGIVRLPIGTHDAVRREPDLIRDAWPVFSISP